MKIVIAYLQAQDRFFTIKERKLITRVVRSRTEKFGRLLQLKGVINFVVSPISSSQGEGFVEGYTVRQDLIMLNIPPAYAVGTLTGSIAHELHHVARGWYMGTESSPPLIEAIFAEGLATAFEVEQVPQELPLHARYNIELIQCWFPRLKKQMWSTRHSDFQWFFQQKGPRANLGYKMGRCLVDQISHAYPHLTPATLARSSIEELVRLCDVLQ